MSKHLNTTQAKQVANAVIAKVRNQNYAKKGEITNADLALSLQQLIASKLDADDLKTYTVTKQQVAEAGYSSTYQLFENGVAVGDKINIPKDLVVESGTVETVETADVPYSGAQVGDKYIDLVIANADNQHIYIPVNDLVDTYTEGNGITISNNVISANVVAENGLSVSASGIAMGAASPSSSGVGGAAGAMSATDKEKLDTIEFATAQDVADLIADLDDIDTEEP